MMKLQLSSSLHFFVILISCSEGFKIFGFDLNRLRYPPRKPTYIPQPPTSSQQAQAPPNPDHNIIQDPTVNWWEDQRRQEQQLQVHSSSNTHIDHAPPAHEVPELPEEQFAKSPIPHQSDNPHEQYIVDVDEKNQDYQYQEIEIITAPTIRSKAPNGRNTFEVKVGAGFHTTKT